MIRCYSTNKEAPKTKLLNAIRTGQAPDKGLYLPERIPVLKPKIIAAMAQMSYPEVASVVLAPYLTELEENELQNPNDIRVGQLLNVPVNLVTPIPTDTPAPQTTPTAAG